MPGGIALYDRRLDALRGTAAEPCAQHRAAPDGYLWIGTELGWIARFDGIRFTHSNPENTPAPGSPETQKLLVDDRKVRHPSAASLSAQLERARSHAMAKNTYVRVRIGKAVEEPNDFFVGVCDSIDGTNTPAAAAGVWTAPRFQNFHLSNRLDSSFVRPDAAAWIRFTPGGEAWLVPAAATESRLRQGRRPGRGARENRRARRLFKTTRRTGTGGINEVTSAPSRPLPSIAGSALRSHSRRIDN